VGATPAGLRSQTSLAPSAESRSTPKTHHLAISAPTKAASHTADVPGFLRQVMTGRVMMIVLSAAWAVGSQKKKRQAAAGQRLSVSVK
jgi:hypothetical protein